MLLHRGLAMRAALASLLLACCLVAGLRSPPPATVLRRDALAAATAAVAAGSVLPDAAEAAGDRGYSAVLGGPFEFGFPLAAPKRATVRRELVPGRIWSFEQVLQALPRGHVVRGRSSER